MWTWARSRSGTASPGSTRRPTTWNPRPSTSSPTRPVWPSSPTPTWPAWSPAGADTWGFGPRRRFRESPPLPRCARAGWRSAWTKSCWSRMVVLRLLGPDIYPDPGAGSRFCVEFCDGSASRTSVRIRDPLRTRLRCATASHRGSERGGNRSGWTGSAGLRRSPLGRVCPGPSVRSLPASERTFNLEDSPDG